jgi:hypothetical protein
MMRFDLTFPDSLFQVTIVVRNAPHDLLNVPYVFSTLLERSCVQRSCARAGSCKPAGISSHFIIRRPLVLSK